VRDGLEREEGGEKGGGGGCVREKEVGGWC